MASPKTAKALPNGTTKAGEKPAPIYAVRVKATRRGFDGELLRNEDEVFLMDVGIMTPMTEMRGLKDGEESVTIPGGAKYILPSWVEKVSKTAPITEPEGHTTVFRREDDVI